MLTPIKKSHPSEISDDGNPYVEARHLARNTDLENLHPLKMKWVDQGIRVLHINMQFSIHHANNYILIKIKLIKFDKANLNFIYINFTLRLRDFCIKLNNSKLFYMQTKY